MSTLSQQIFSNGTFIDGIVYDLQQIYKVSICLVNKFICHSTLPKLWRKPGFFYSSNQISKFTKCLDLYLCTNNNRTYGPMAKHVCFSQLQERWSELEY